MNKQNRVVAIQKAKIFPTNAQERFSFKNGNPQITFNIAPDTKLLDTKTLRLNFTLEILSNTGAEDAKITPNLQDVLQTGDAKACNLDARVAVNSVIDTLRLRSQDTNEVIEEVRSYSRLLASVIPSLSSFGSYQNWISNKNHAFARQDVEGIAVVSQIPVSLQLRSGLLNSGQPINLMSMGGMVCDIMLSPDSFCLFGGNASEFFYRLSDVNMTWNWLELSSPLSPSVSQFQYPAFNSYMNVVQSSDDQQSLLLALQSVRSVFSNSIPSSKLNNFAFNCLETPRLQNTADAGVTFTDASVKEYTHLRNNVKFNKAYSVDERQAVTDGVYESHKNREFLDCIQPFRNITATLQSPETQGVKSVDATNLNVPDTLYVGGIGCNFDPTASGAGVNFANAQYALSNQGLNVKNQQVQPVQ